MLRDCGLLYFHHGPDFVWSSRVLRYNVPYHRWCLSWVMFQFTRVFRPSLVLVLANCSTRHPAEQSDELS